MAPKTIQVKSKRGILEITDQCVTMCPWCYDKRFAGTRNPHLPYEMIGRRSDWIKTHTDVQYLSLAGGEPLLHPEYERICEHLLSEGFQVRPITSGKVTPATKSNLDYLVAKYHEWKMFPQLSFQWDRNADDILSLFDRLHSAWPKELAKTDDPDHHDIYMRVVVGIAPYETYRRCMTSLFDRTRGSGSAAIMVEYEGHTMTMESYLQTQYEQVQQGLGSTFTSGKLHGWDISVTLEDGFKYELSFAPEEKIDMLGNQTRVRPFRNDLTRCPGMLSNANRAERTIKLDSLAVTTRGGATFSQPACFSAHGLLGLVDGLETPEAVYESFYRSLRSMHSLIRITKAAGADTPYGFCKTDRDFPGDEKGKETSCTYCSLPTACNICVNESHDDFIDAEKMAGLIAKYGPVVADQY